MINYKILFYNRNIRLYECHKILYRYYNLDGVIRWGIYSNRHSWLAKLPLKDNILVCRDCNMETGIENFSVKKCRMHNIGITFD